MGEKIEINKLVRDKVPNMITEKGAIAEFRILGGEEYLKALNDRLDDAFDIYMDKPSLENLAGIYAIINALAVAFGSNEKELGYRCSEMIKEKGSYSSRIYLESIVEND